MKADHAAEYKQLPLPPKDQRDAIIALRRPSDGEWFGCTSRTLVFGAKAAVLHCNVFPRLITALVNHLLGIPLICCFGDFAALPPEIMENKAIQVFTAFFPPTGNSAETG